MKFLSIYCFLFIIYVIDASLWTKHYITYSIESNTSFNHIMHEAIQEWNVSSLEIQPAETGDIKIKMENCYKSTVLGYANYPPVGDVNISRCLNGIDLLEDHVIDIASKLILKQVTQHEFGHALGLSHNSEDMESIMFPAITLGISKITKDDLKRLYELYKCRYDSVTLLNYYTYFKFQGRHYERIDLNTNETTRDIIWHPSIVKVDAMYRNDTYFIISNNQYYEFDNEMKYVRSGSIHAKFPNIKHKINAVLTMHNGSVLAFLNNADIWYDGKIYSNWFLPHVRIQGAYMTENQNIIITIKDYRWIYDKTFTFIQKERLCDITENIGKIHCCNTYSNIS